MNNGTDAFSAASPASTINHPAVLGPLGLALASLCLGLNLVFPATAPFLAGLGLLAGGVAQLLAGLNAWSRGREAAATAFSAMGLFFLSLLPLLILPALGLGRDPGAVALGSYLVMWSIFFGIVTSGLRQCSPVCTLPTATGLQSAALALLALALLTGHTPLARLSGMLLLGAGLVSSLAAFAGVSPNGSGCPR